jgi:hypothetical protein
VQVALAPCVLQQSPLPLLQAPPKAMQHSCGAPGPATVLQVNAASPARPLGQQSVDWAQLLWGSWQHVLGLVFWLQAPPVQSQMLLPALQFVPGAWQHCPSWQESAARQQSVFAVQPVFVAAKQH